MYGYTADLPHHLMVNFKMSGDSYLGPLSFLETVTSTVIKVLVLFWWKDASVCHTEDGLGLVLTFCLYIFP